MKWTMLVVFLMISFFVRSQSGLHVTVYTAGYNLKADKKLLRETGLPVTKNFPGGLNFEIGYSGGSSENVFGVYYNHIGTTGIASSGSAEVKHQVNRESIGILDYYHIENGFYAGGKFCFNSNVLNIKTKGLQPAYDEDFTSYGFSIAPTLLYTRAFGQFSGRLEASYEWNHQSSLEQSSSGRYLATADGKQVPMNLSGYRLGIGVAYKFQKSAPRPKKVENYY